MIETPVRQNQDAGIKHAEVHLACDCNLDKAMCGYPRNGEPFRPGIGVTCVVCADLARVGCNKCGVRRP